MSASLSAPSFSTQPEPQPPTQDSPAFRYFRPPSAHQPRTDLPDNYFEPTSADIRAQQAMLTARRDALQNAPLRTSVMREVDDKKRRARWPNTTIRIKFADRSMLEKTFPSTDKIRSVYAFVRGSLREDVKPVKFVLYQSPPKREYKVSDPKVRDLSLAELDFAPSSVLMIKFDDDRFNHIDVAAPLDASILGAMEDIPVPPDFDKDPKDDKHATTGSDPKPKPSGKSADGEKKLPKWLRLGPK